MIYLNVNEIIELHSKLIKKTGGLDGIRDRGLLESAIYSVFAGFDDEERYPTLEEKAARYAYALTTNHAFLDGNKRIGILIMLTTLKLNHVNLSFSQKELIQLGLSIADGTMNYEDVYRWVLAHKVNS